MKSLCTLPLLVALLYTSSLMAHAAAVGEAATSGKQVGRRLLACVDTFAACPGWVGQCTVPGVATYCPCMCGRRSPPATPPPSTPTPPPSTTTPPPSTPTAPPTGGCKDTYAACPAWVGQCAVPGVATYCPCMCRGGGGSSPPPVTPPPTVQPPPSNPPTVTPPPSGPVGAIGITQAQFSCVFAGDQDITGAANNQALIDQHWAFFNSAAAAMGGFAFGNAAEAATFLGNVKHEYGGFLGNMNENCFRTTGSAQACSAGGYDDCGTGSSNYFGRGPLQLTHCYNYKAMSAYVGVDLGANPAAVADPNTDLAWRTAIGFWTKPDFLCGGKWNAELAALATCTEAARASNIAVVTRRINGALECRNPPPANQRSRVQKINAVRQTCFGLAAVPESQALCY